MRKCKYPSYRLLVEASRHYKCARLRCELIPSSPPKCMIANCQDLDWQFGKNYGRKKIIIYFLKILHFFSTERREKRINRKRINFKTRRSFFLFPFFFPPPSFHCLHKWWTKRILTYISSSHNRVRLLRRYLVARSIFKGSPFTVAKRGCRINKRMSNRDRGGRRENLPKDSSSVLDRANLSRKIVFRENGKTVHGPSAMSYDEKRLNSPSLHHRSANSASFYPPEELLHSGFLTWHARLSFKGADRVRGRIPLSERSCYGAATCYLLWK